MPTVKLHPVPNAWPIEEETNSNPQISDPPNLPPSNLSIDRPPKPKPHSILPLNLRIRKDTSVTLPNSTSTPPSQIPNPSNLPPSSHNHSNQHSPREDQKLDESLETSNAEAQSKEEEEEEDDDDEEAQNQHQIQIHTPQREKLTIAPQIPSRVTNLASHPVDNLKVTIDRSCFSCFKRAPPSALIPCASCDRALHTHCHAPPMRFAPTYPWRCPKCLQKRRSFAETKQVGTQTDDRTSVYMEDEDRSWLPPKLRNKPQLAARLPAKPRHRTLPDPAVVMPFTYGKAIRLNSGAVVPLRYAIDGMSAWFSDDEERQDDDQAAYAEADSYDLPPNMRSCEYCATRHQGTFGSGRFCSSKCARSVGGLSRRKNPSEVEPSPDVLPTRGRGRGKARGRGRGKGRGGRGRGRGKVRGRGGSSAAEHAGGYPSVRDTSDEGEEVIFGGVLSDGTLPRSRYGRVVRSRASARGEAENKNSSGGSSPDRHQLLSSKVTGDGDSGSRGVQGLEGNTKDKDNMYSDNTIESGGDAKELYNGVELAHNDKDASIYEEYGAVRKSGRSRKRSAIHLDNAEDEYGDQKVRVPNPGNTSRRNDEYNSWTTGRGGANKKASGNAAGEGRPVRALTVKRARQYTVKPGKGYKFCHECDELIANRRFFCTSCGAENPSARRAPKGSTAKEEGKAKNKAGRPKKNKLSEAPAGDSAEMKQKNGKITDDDKKILLECGYGSIDDMLRKPPPEPKEESSKAAKACWELYMRTKDERDSWCGEDQEEDVTEQSQDLEGKEEGGEKDEAGSGSMEIEGEQAGSMEVDSENKSGEGADQIHNW